jgi:hypothetical protein
LKDGKWTSWFENGQKSSEWTYKDGKRIGSAAEWHENGQKVAEGTYKDGEPEKETAMATDNVPILTQRVQAISEIQLLTDFMLDKNDQRLLPVAPPFYVKLITMDQIAFTIRLDSAEIRSKFLQANDEYDFVGIENKTDFLFTDTKGLSIYINAHSLQNISNYEHPLKLTLKPNPPTMIVQWYKPLR